MPDSQLVGLIGLGAAGSQIALLLAEHGYQLLVADARPQSHFEAMLAEGAGRLRWATADEVCRECETVCTSLPSVAVIAEVAARHIFPHMRSGGTWIDLSTTDEEEVKRLGPLAKQRGIDLLEAPLTGGVHLVRSGDMTVLVGGDRAVLARHSGLLDTIGGKVVYCGGWGSACAPRRPKAARRDDSYSQPQPACGIAARRRIRRRIAEEPRSRRPPCKRRSARGLRRSPGSLLRRPAARW